MRSARDYLYSTVQARARYRREGGRRLPNAPSFRRWARATYNPGACLGKLKEIVLRDRRHQT